MVPKGHGREHRKSSCNGRHGALQTVSHQSQSQVCLAALPSLEDLDLALCPLSDVCLLCQRQHEEREVAALGSHCFSLDLFQAANQGAGPPKAELSLWNKFISVNRHQWTLRKVGERTE